MSNSKTPLEVVLKPGGYQSKNTSGGLNLRKWIFRMLTRNGFAGTNDPDCCQYFPVTPDVLTVNSSNPTAEEMANVPIGGFFRAVENTSDIWYMYIKIDNDGGANQIATNN